MTDILRAATTDAPGIDVKEMIDRGAWTPYQKLVLALIALAYVTDGVANQSLGLAIPALMRDWGLGRGAFAPIAAVGLVGLTIGALVGGVLGDRFGRRWTMIASTAFFGLATMAQAWVTNPTELLVLRFIDGIGIGAMIPNGAAMIVEFTPARKRAFALSIGMSFIAAGAMVSGLIGNLVVEPYGWEGIFLALGGIGVAVSLLLLALLPESPIFLVVSGAERARIRAAALRCGVEIGDAPLVAVGPPAGPKRMPLSTLFAPAVASSTVFLWIAFFFCLLANYAMFSWVPAMLASLGFALSLTGLGMTFLSLGGILGGIGCGWLIARYGSRLVVLILAGGGVAASLALGTYTGSVSSGARADLSVVLALLFVIGIFASGLLNGLYTFSAFIYPDHARSTGVGAAAAAGRIGAIASSFAGVFALSAGGASGYFQLIAGSLAISLVMVALIKRQIARDA